MDFLVAVAPIVVLTIVMTIPRGLPSYIALPLVAGLLYVFKLVYFGNSPTLVNATVVFGLLEALIPISIVFGAILLFRTMERSGAMDTIRLWLNSLTTNSVGQLMVVGWAFVFLIEGASGFGTPAALAAPLLVGMGFKPLRVAILCLVMDSVPVTFGAVGTPVWFGLGDVVAESTARADLLAVSWRAAVLNSAAALVVPVMALCFVLPWCVVRRNLVFVYLSIVACVVPYVLVATVNYEFPALAGGFIGLLISAALAKYGVGLDRHSVPMVASATTVPQLSKPSTGALVKALFPLWGTLLLLVVTRISQLGLKDVLKMSEPSVALELGGLFTLQVSPALVIQALGILGQDGIDTLNVVNWKYETLYIPALIPFVLIAGLTWLLYAMPPRAVRECVVTSARQMANPVLALLGALVLVKLLMMQEFVVGGGMIPAASQTIGLSVAAVLGPVWQYFAVFLGALGAFFSGSATVSNMTFGAVQADIAASSGMSTYGVLAQQSAGAAMGNMVCIHNIVAVCSILALEKAEGYILVRTALPMLVYGVMVVATGLLLP